MKPARANSTLPEKTPEDTRETPLAPEDENRVTESGRPHIRWSWRKMLFLILLAVVVHVALICFFGTKKPIPPRRVTNVPHLHLSSDSDPFIASADPTLFALPNPRDFASTIWLTVPVVAPPSFRWDEAPQWLPLDTGNARAVFQQFLPSDNVSEVQLDVKPPMHLSVESPTLGTALPDSSTLRILGALAQRGPLDPVALPSLPYNNVIPPSKIQLLVDTSGTVLSAILLPLTDGLEAMERCDPADRSALEIARHLRFAPARQPAFGEIVFRWHAVPVPLTTTPTTP
jgi:hypothetical protein